MLRFRYPGDVFIVFPGASQAPTVEVKMAWLSELRRILTNQQKLLRGLTIDACTHIHMLFVCCFLRLESNQSQNQREFFYASLNKYMLKNKKL